MKIECWRKGCGVRMAREMCWLLLTLRICSYCSKVSNMYRVLKMSLTSWFLVQTKPNGHRLAERNLKRQGFETFLPLQEVTKRRSSRFVNDFRPLFPGYMFVAFDPDTAPWRQINGTFGVSRLVNFEHAPRALPQCLITDLMLRCDAEGKLLPPRTMAVGDEVELLTGPFAKFIGTIEAFDAEQRIWVLLELMGQQTRVNVGRENMQHNR